MTRDTPAVDSAAAARQVQSAWDAARLERNLSRVHARARLRSRLVKGGAGALGLVAVAAGFALLAGPSEVAPIVPPSVALAPSAGVPKTTFTDGSVARVSDGGELVVNLATPERIESVLSSGSAEFEVTERAGRDFVVLAGPVQVRVVGTRFRIERLGERTLVSVSEGKVEAREGERVGFLTAGESRFFPTPADVAPQPSAAPARDSARSRFLELSRGGQYKAAYQILSQSPGIVGSGPEELMLAADAARLSSHPEQAIGYLRRVTSEHPKDSRAPLAAFTAGRVLQSQLGRASEAAEAFALSRRLRPTGSLAEDALAREAEARAQSGAVGLARRLAAAYVARYPKGKHAVSMQRLVTGQ
jgi:TolA-binding protein